uniref:Uncharacterized protein n=1 Tax=Anopheles culicifacies TaxID=139723 RepID=A0A182MHB2_9DIPT
MFPKKFKQSGMLYKKSAQLEAQFEREWDNLPGSSSQSAIVQSVEDVAMNDLSHELEAEYIEEEYLEEIDEDDRYSEQASIPNDGTDDEAAYEEEFLEEEVLDMDPECSKLRNSLRTWLIRNKVSRCQDIAESSGKSKRTDRCSSRWRSNVVSRC